MVQINRLIIIGASGHGKVVADIARLCGYTDIVFLDNDTTIKQCARCQVLGPDTMAGELEGDLFVAVGNSNIRKSLMNRYQGRNFPVLVHPKAVLAQDIEIGVGSVIMAGAIINPNTKIGKGCIINTGASIDHDCAIGDFVHVAVGAHLCGTVNVGEETWIGAGSTVSNNVDICGACMIGVGAAVVKSIYAPGVYVGIPAVMIRGNVGDNN